MQQRFEWRSHSLPRRVVVITGNPDVDDMHETVRQLVGAEEAPAFLAAAAAAPSSASPPPSVRRSKQDAARRVLSSLVSSASASSAWGRSSPVGAAAAAGAAATAAGVVLGAGPAAAGASTADKKSKPTLSTNASAAMVPAAVPMPPSLAHLGPAEGSLARRATASLRVFGDEFLRAPPPPEEQQAPLAYRLGVVSKFQLIPQGSLEGDDEAGDADEEEEDEEAGVAAAADGTTGQATEAASAPSPTALSAPGQTSHPSPPTGVVGKNGASGSKAKLPMHKRNVHKTLLERSNSPPRRALYDMRREGLHLAIERARSPAFQSGTGDGLDDGAGGDDGSLGWREEQAWGGAASLRRGDRFDMRQSPRRRGRFGDEPVEEQRLLTPGQLKQAVEEAFTYLMSNDGAEPAQPAAEAADGDDEEEEGKEDFDEEEEEERLASHPHTPSESSSASPSSTPLDLASKQEGTAADTSSPIGGGRSGGAIVTAGGASGGLSGVKLRARVAMAEAKEADTKLQCAQSLCTWAAHEGNVERLFTEGAVDAVIRLSKEQQPLIRRYCARAFRRMSARPLLAKEMLAVGGIVSLLARMVRPEAPTPPAASTRGAGALSPYQYQQQQQQQQLQQYQHAVPQQVVVDCLAALVNLTTVPESEAQLVEDGIVPALMSSLKDREDYDELCARGLYNLTCVDAPYPFIDRVIKALVSLAASGVPAVRQLCALALCNLAALKPMRLRLVEEGVVQATGMLIRGGDPTTRRACSVILHSLTSTKSVRAEMVSRGGIPLLRLLSADRDNAALRCVALALLRLASEDAGLLRLASEGGVLALNAVVLKCAATQQTRTVRACAHALHALSRKPELHGVLILQRQQQVQQGEATPGVNESEATEDGGALGALMAILRASSAAQDHSTVHFALFALCNLLALADNHGPIQRSGGIPTLVHLCRHAGLRHHDLRAPCAYAIFTLTRTHAEARQEAVASGAIPVLVGLVNESGEEGEEEEDGQGQQQAQHDQRRLLRAFCAATLALLATDTDNLPVMLEEGVLATFVRLLQDRSETTTVRFCCAALCRFARDADVCLRVLESGAVPHLIAGAMEGERGAGQACCTVLAALSAQPDSRQRLCQQHPDVLPALLSLAATDDEATKLRCAATLANLSCERLARGLMVRHGVVRVLADLSTSYSEEAQAHCATALCNLACLEGEEPAVVAQGGLGALMMIGMVRAVSLPTKRLCAQAMLNLLTPQTLGAATEEGLVPACATLSKLEDEASMAACALIFARLSTDARARRQLAEKVGALHALIHLMRARSLHTQLVVGQSVCNLLTAADSRPMALREGGLGVLKEIVELLADDDEGDEEERREMKEDEAAARDGLEGYITQTLFRLCQLPDHRPRLLAADMTPVVLTLLARTGGPVGEHKARRDLCVRMLALFLWHAEARAQFVRHGGVALLVRVMRSGDGEDEAGYRMVAETCVRAAVYLALEPELQPALLKGQVLPAVRHLHASQRLTVRSYEMVALLLRLLTAGCTDPASPSASLALPLLQAGGLSLLRALVTVLQHHSGALLHCTVAVFNFVLEREALEAFAATEDQEQPAADEEVTAVLEAVLVALGDKPACRPLVSAVLAQLSVGLSRYGLLVQMDGVLPLVHRFLLLAPADQEGPLRDPTTALIIQNACATVLALSKASPVCRLQLQRAGFLPHLLHLSKTPSMGPAIVQLAANALRRLSSTVSAPAMDVGRAGGRGGSVAGVKEGAVAALIATALDSPLTAEQESGPDELPPAVPAMEPADALPYAPPETAQGVDHEQLQRELVLQATSAPKIAARARVAALPDVPESSSVSLEFDAAVPTLATGLPTAIDLPTSSLQGFKGARRDGDEDDNEDAEQDDVRAAFAGKLGLPAGVLLLAEPDILEEVERERQQLKASQLAAGGSASQQRRGAAAGGGPSRRPGALAGPGSSRLTALRKPRSTILYRTSSSASDDGPPSPYAEVLTHKSSATSVFGSTGGSSSSAVGGTPRGAGKRRMKAAALLVRTSLLALGGGGGGRDSQSTPQEAEEGKEGAAADGPDGSLQSTMEEGGEREADGAEGGEEAGGAHESSQPPTSPPPQQQKSQQQQHPSSLPPPDPKRGSTTNTSVAAGLSAAGMLKGGELERPAAAAKAGVISAGATTAVNKSAAPSPFLRLDEDALLQLQPPLPIDHAGKTRLADPFDKSEESLVHNMRMPHSFTGATTVASASSRRGDGRGAAGGSGARRPAGGTGK